MKCNTRNASSVSCDSMNLYGKALHFFLAVNFDQKDADSIPGRSWTHPCVPRMYVNVQIRLHMIIATCFEQLRGSSSLVKNLRVLSVI